MIDNHMHLEHYTYSILALKDLWNKGEDAASTSSDLASTVIIS
jgi:hypothetical protein